MTDDALLEQLRQAVSDPGQVTTNATVREQHGTDLSPHPDRSPDVVVYARSRDDVSAVLAVCHERRVPVIPFGAGSSLEGHIIPTRDGVVSLDLSEMNAIVQISPENLRATVQPGVLRSALNRQAGNHGLFFPVDPGADATLGGMVATNASGTTTVRYGSMRAQVMMLEVVLADGQVVRTGTATRKSSAGYDLTGLFVGSEGTLGVITEVTLRLRGVPDYTVAARAVFPDVAAACSTAAATIAAGLGVSRLELLDAQTVKAINAYAGRDDPEMPCLLIEAEGSRAAVEEDMSIIEQLALEQGGVAFQTESDPTARARLWKARHDAAWAVIATAPGKRSLSTDVCVPVSELPGAVAAARATLERLGVAAASIAGHVGDGNYHAVFMVDPDDPEDVAKAAAVSAALVEQALSVGGTCSGEHGIGVGKKGYLRAQHGDLLPFMASIKHSFDPSGILNPGKVFDEGTMRSDA